jgi:hypothetical protein
MDEQKTKRQNRVSAVIEIPEKDWTYEAEGCEGDVEKGRVLLKRETLDGSH